MPRSEDTSIELILAQQRVITQQNDKMLEYLEAIYQGLVNLGEPGAAEEPPRAAPAAEGKSVADILKDLLDADEPKDPTRPGFGYDALLERQERGEHGN